ncbi:MAG: hypothetical protein ABIJ03_03380 [Patescibacteria group bacterium]|nr:hypothetical protein [Patescibacteria group bacterium]
MTKLSQINSSIEERQVKKDDQALVLRIPKPNLQVMVLGLIAIITLFQTFQLTRISSRASSFLAKATQPPAVVSSSSGSSDMGSNSDVAVPQSMVGGC